MDLTHYIFALFVFFLVCASIWVYSRVSRIRKKSDKGDYEKEQRLFKLFQNVEDMMNGFEEYVEQSKKEMDENISEISTMTDKLDIMSKKAELNIQKKEIAVEQKKRAPKVKAPSDPSKPKSKIEELISLIDEGKSKSEIAKTLGISDREVSLIMEIKKIKEPEQ